MKVSMTLQSTISKTKKRLSDDHWLTPIIVLSVLGLFAALMAGFRTVAAGRAYGVVPAEIPVMPVAFDDPTYHRHDERYSGQLRKTTPTIVLTKDSFYFGDLRAFSTEFVDVRNKFKIRHEDGRPRLGKLLETMAKWEESRDRGSEDKESNIAVFIPTPEIPVPIVIQIVAHLRQASPYQRIVLGGGLL